MKKMFCILTTIIVTTVILSLFLTGCSERGKIGNGENGTIYDNSKNATENATRATDITNNGSTESLTDKDVDDNPNDNSAENNDDNILGGEDNNNNTGDDNNTVDNQETPTELNSQQGIAGDIGDAIDEGVSNIKDDITGTDATD